VRHRIVRLNHIVGSRQNFVGSTGLAKCFSWLMSRFAQFLRKLVRVVVSVGAVVPNDFQRVATLPSCPRAVGANGDSTQRIEHRSSFECRDFQHVRDTGDFHRFGGIEGFDLPSHHRWSGDDRVDLSLHSRVDAIHRLAREDGVHVGDGRVLADVSPLIPGFEFQVLGLRHLQRFGNRDKIPEVNGTTAGPVFNEMVVRETLVRGNVPLLGGGLLQHRSRGGTGNAHSLKEKSDAVRAVRVLVSQAFVTGSLPDFDPFPIGLKLIGDHPRQPRSDSRSHLGAVRKDDDGAIGCHGDKKVWRKVFDVCRGCLDNVDTLSLAGSSHQNEGTCCDARDETATRHVAFVMSSFGKSGWFSHGSESPLLPL